MQIWNNGKRTRMLGRSKKVICAWVSLALERHKENRPFELPKVLFTRAELHERAEEIYQLTINDYIIQQMTVGRADPGVGQYLITCSSTSLLQYYWLCCPDEYTGYDVDEIVDGLLNSNWINRTPFRTREQIINVLKEYYQFISQVSVSEQVEDPRIITREAVWLAVATLTYNDFKRTGSHDSCTYQYPQNVISKLAHTFNTGNSVNTCGQMTRTSCTTGIGQQPWSYLVDAGGIRRDNRRRLTYYGEFEYTQPDLHEEFQISTVTGVITARELSAFIKDEYSPIFFKHLIPPLDESHSIEEMEQHALQMDYESLRAAAVSRGESHPEPRTTTITRYSRDPYISVYAKERAHGICQLCNKEAPFKNSRNEPYLETHHIIWLAQGGSDSTDNVVALCPNCHRKMHIVNDNRDVEMLQKLVITGK